MRRFQPTSSKGIRLRAGPGRMQGPTSGHMAPAPAPTFLTYVTVALCFESRGCSWVTRTGACGPALPEGG